MTRLLRYVLIRYRVALSKFCNITRSHPWSRCADTPSCPTDGQEMFMRVMLGKLVQNRSGSVGFIPHRGKGRRGHVCSGGEAQAS
jgi:hypothetical protein